MGEKVLRIKALADPSDAVAGLAIIGNSLEKVGSAALATAERSKQEWKALEEEWRQADPTLRGVADAAFKVEGALNRAAKTEDVARLAAELVKAQQAVDLFAAKLGQIEAGGGVVDEKTLGTLRAYEEAVTSLKGKMELLATAQAEATAKIKGGETQLDGMAAAAKEAADAAAALSSVKGPEQLEGAIKRGAWASIQLREEIDRASAAGEKIDDKTVSALKAVEAQTQSSIEKMTRFRKEMGDAGENAKLATNKLDALKGASGGLSSAFDSMEKSGTGVTKAIGSFGIALGAMGAAIAGAVAAGKELGEGIDKLSAKYAALQQKEIDAALAQQKQEIALRAADRGLIEHGKTIAETVANYDKYALAQGKFSEGARKIAEEVGGLKIPPTYEDLGKQVEAIGAAFEGAYKRGEEFGDRMLLENASVIETLVQKYQQLGKEVPEDLAALAEALKELKGAADDAGAAMGAATEPAQALTNGVADLKAALNGIGSTSAAEAIQKVADAINKAKAAGEGWQPVVFDNQKKLEQLYDQASKEGYAALDGLRKKVMDQIPAWQAAAMANANYANQLDETATAQGRTVEQQTAYDQNTRDLADSIAKARAEHNAWNDGLTAQMDLWGKIGDAMGPFSVQIARAVEGYQSQGNALDDMIQRLAEVSDSFPRMQMFFGGWIEQLRQGQITVKEFEQILAGFRTGMIQYSGMLNGIYGDYDQVLNELYAATEDFQSGTEKILEKMASNWQSSFFKARDAAKQLREELEVVEVTAGRVNEAVSGDMGIKPKDLEDGFRKPRRRTPGTQGS